MLDVAAAGWATRGKGVSFLSSKAFLRRPRLDGDGSIRIEIRRRRPKPQRPSTFNVKGRLITGCRGAAQFVSSGLAKQVELTAHSLRDGDGAPYMRAMLLDWRCCY